MKPLVISFSGGRTSAYMAAKLKEKYNGVRPIYFIFFNTSKERKETYDFVNKCDLFFGLNLVWLEADYDDPKGFRVVSYETAKRNGEVFEEVIKRYGIPDVNFMSCTREMKTRVALKWLKYMKLKNYEQALGIRIDEPKRLTPKPNIIYPLATDFPTTKLMVNRWWANQPFDLELKGYEGNCDMCYKKSKRKLMTILIEHPELAEWWNEMEIKYGEHVLPSQKNRTTPVTFFRHHESMQDLIEDSKFPFKLATDDFTKQDLMFSQPELDFTNGCEESCEAF